MTDDEIEEFVIIIFYRILILPFAQWVLTVGPINGPKRIHTYHYFDKHEKRICI